MPYMSLPLIGLVTVGVASAIAGGAVAYRKLNHNHRRSQLLGKRKRRRWVS